MGAASKKRIVIVGGGFAGVSAYRAISSCCDDSFELLLVSDSNLFVHTPLVHEVAACALPADVVSWPLEKYIACPKDTLVFGRVTFVDADKKFVTITSKSGEHTLLPFDFLVLAAGSVPAVPDIIGARQLLYLRTLSDAEKIRKHILERFREALTTTNEEERNKILSFVCVGAGVTGIELVGELSDLCSNELARQYPELRRNVSITLLNNRDAITLGAHPWFGLGAQQRLLEFPLVEVMHDTKVQKITHDGVLTDKKLIPSKTVIWTGGVSGAQIPIASQPPISHDSRGRTLVTPALHLEGYKNIFVVGDAASIPRGDGNTYGMQAQFAVREGTRAGKNVMRVLRGKQPVPFEARERGFLVPIGKHFGLAEIFGIKFSGMFAWHFSHIIYVLSVVRWDLKLQVAWKWLYYLMCRRKTV